MLIQGSAILLEGEAVRLSAMDPYGEDYDKSYYWSCFSSHAIWCVQDDLTSMLQDCGEDADYEFRNLRFSPGCIFQFSINHYSPKYGTQKDETVTVKRIVGGDSMQRLNDQNELRQARQDRESLISDFVGECIKDGAITGLSVYAPEIAMTLSFLSMSLGKKAGTISGASDLIDGKLQKAAFEVANTVVANTINTVMNLQMAEAKMDALNREKLMEMVGSGAYYDRQSGGALEKKKTLLHLSIFMILMRCAHLIIGITMVFWGGQNMVEMRGKL